MYYIKTSGYSKHKIILISTIVANFSFASGIRLPEQSLNGTALNSAYIAGAYGADSSYYNPANITLGDDTYNHSFEVNGMIIFIPGFSFTAPNRDYGVNVSDRFGIARGHFCEDNGSSKLVSSSPQYGVPCGGETIEGNAKNTIQPVPKIFFKTSTSSLPGDIRLGLGASFTTPSGLSMDWDGKGGEFLDDVTIAMLEFNPVVSASWNDFIAIGGGFRAIYAGGKFNNTLYVPYSTNISFPIIGNVASEGTTRVEQQSSAKDWGFGYNVALTIKPFRFSDVEFLQGTTLAVTYRSKVTWAMKGSLHAKSYIYQGKDITLVEGYIGMDADLVLDADLPPILNIGLAQDIDRFRFEFVYERTFYGSARIFEFSYTNHKFSKHLSGSSLAINFIDPESMLGAADYSAVAYGSGWKDAQAFRLGISYFGDTYSLMSGLAYDQTPAPQGKFGIPDADGYMFGIGGRKYLFGDNFNFGAAYSLTLKDNRKSFIMSHDGLGKLHLLTLGVQYLW